MFPRRPCGWSLSKILCQEGFRVEFGFEVVAEDLVEGAQVGEQDWARATPFMVIEVVGQEFHFDEGFSLGVEVAAGIAAEVFDLVINALGQVGGTQVRADWAGIFDKSEVIGNAFLEVLDPGLVGWAKLLEQGAELGLSGFE